MFSGWTVCGDIWPELASRRTVIGAVLTVGERNWSNRPGRDIT